VEPEYYSILGVAVAGAVRAELPGPVEPEERVELTEEGLLVQALARMAE